MASKEMLNTACVVNVWKEIVLSTKALAHITMRPETPTTAFDLSYETASDAARNLLFFTIQPGESWSDSFASTIPLKTLWVRCDDNDTMQTELTVRG